MTRTSTALAVVALGAIACNNGYQFTPAGRCLIQPGSVRVRLDPTSSADILFVVDDSPSTNEKQAGLAASFGDFIGRMVQTNVARTSRGLDPIDFHVAVTTSSVLEAKPGNGWCVGGNSCCQTTACTPVSTCTLGTAGGCGAGQVCLSRPQVDQTGQIVLGEQLECCAATACTPTASCAAGDACPAIATSYPNPFPPASFCTPGLAVAGQPYPAGALQSAGTNPKVLDFDKTLDWASWGTARQDPRLTALVSQFAQNVRVGSCGSGEEQHLEAARLTFEKAASGQLAGAPGFPHPGAKLVVAWVGDEDDCSSPSNAPLVMAGFGTGADSCVWDKRRPAAEQREIPVGAYADFFTGLVHPGGASSFAAGFIVAAARCGDGTYAPADACVNGPSCPTAAPASCAPAAATCGGAYAAGERFLALADALKARGVEVVEGTVCDAYPPATFGPVLAAIADLAKPPAMLRLPGQPAARSVTNVTIAGANGITRRSCQEGRDWCFVDCADESAAPACLPSGTSQCIAIDHVAGSCEANPGETYAAEYLGVLPPGGCATAADCRAALGGDEKAWSCTKEAGAVRGTCTCNP